VTYATSAYTAYAEFVEFADESLNEPLPWYSATQRICLRERCAELGVRFFDLTPALQEAAQSLGPDDLLDFPINLHWTPNGNRVVAEALAPIVNDLQHNRSRKGQAFSQSWRLLAIDSIG